MEELYRYQVLRSVGPSGDRGIEPPAHDEGAASARREVSDPNRPRPTSPTQARLRDLLLAAAAARRLAAGESSSDEVRELLGSIPFGAQVASLMAAVGAEATAAQLESEGEMLVRRHRSPGAAPGAAPSSWGAITNLVGAAHRPATDPRPLPIAGDAPPTGFGGAVAAILAGEDVADALNRITFDMWLHTFDMWLDTRPSRLEPIGIQDLIVVRKRHLGYRLAELSHIENIAAGETRDRVHRTETEIETLGIEELEREEETEDDLATTTRDELRNEIQRQTQEKLDLSGKVRLTYRGPVEVEVEAAAESSREEQRRTSTTRNHAVEVTEEASSRVRDRTLRRTERRFRRLVAETNQHTFVNETGNDRAVQYAWLQKVDRVALFNYGARLMYEVVVPEPAAHLRALSAGAPAPEVPARRPPTTYFNGLFDGDTDIVKEWDEGRLHQHFDLEGLDEPPSEAWVERSLHVQGEGPESEPETSLTIPDGREGTSMRVSCQTWLDNTDSTEHNRVPRLSLVVGPFHLWLNEDTLDRRTQPANMVGAGLPGRWTMQIGDRGRQTGPFLTRTREGEEVLQTTGEPYEVFDVDLGVHAMKPGTYDVKVVTTPISSYAVTVAVQTKVSEDGQKAWRQALTAAVVADYWRQHEAYTSLALSERPTNASEPLENLSAAQSAELREIERDEVKRAALAVIRNQDPEGADALVDTRPQVARWYRDNRELIDEILFLEQAFEWQHMSFVLYGYHWSAQEDWSLQIFGHRGGDRGFREFLKAGAARVQIPVRPGFGDFVKDYMMEGVVWSAGDRPTIGDTGFVDLATERLERLGVPGDEAPMAERVDEDTKQPIYWDVTTPTDLVMIKTWESPDQAPLDRWAPPAPEELQVALDGDTPNPLAHWTPGRGPVPDEPHAP